MTRQVRRSEEKTHGTIDTMITVVEYLVIAVVIGAVVFVLAAVVFGRGEQMAPLPARTSPSELPAHGIRGEHVRDVRFGLALRGYRMSDVDWTLERLADEIDTLRARLDGSVGEEYPGGTGGVDPGDVDPGGVEREQQAAVEAGPVPTVDRGTDEAMATPLSQPESVGLPTAPETDAR